MNDPHLRASTCASRCPIWPFATLILGVLVGLVIPIGSRWLQLSTTPGAAPPAPFVLSEWEYPGATSLQKAEGGSIETQQFGRSTVTVYWPSLFSYKTTDAFESVWSHFAKLAGINDAEFKPGMSASMGSVIYYTGDPNRKSVRSATIINNHPGYTVTVFLSHGENDQQTNIDIAVEKKTGQQ